MNVLILSEKLWPEGGGGELATHLYARLLAEKGINVKIATTSSSSSSRDVWSGLPVHKLRAVGHGKYTLILGLKELGRLIRWADVIYCTELFSVIPFVKRNFKKPVVVHLHSYFPACPVGSLYDLRKDSVCKSDGHECAKCIWYYEKAHSRSLMQATNSAILNSTIGKLFLNSVRLADAIIFVSEAQRSLFSEHAYFSSPSYVIYNPLPELPYTPIEGDDLGFFGGLSPLKGFHILAKALSKIRNKHQVKLHAAKMERLVYPGPFAKVGIIPYGKLYNASYENVYRRVRTVVFPSICQESFGYVALEALIRGRLLVASRVGGVPEITEGLKGVLMTEPNDVDGLAEALDQAISIDRSKAIELGLKNRESVLKKFDNQRSVSELIRVFERVSS